MAAMTGTRELLVLLKREGDDDLSSVYMKHGYQAFFTLRKGGGAAHHLPGEPDYPNESPRIG